MISYPQRLHQVSPQLDESISIAIEYTLLAKYLLWTHIGHRLPKNSSMVQIKMRVLGITSVQFFLGRMAMIGSVYKVVESILHCESTPDQLNFIEKR